MIQLFITRVNTLFIGTTYRLFNTVKNTKNKTKNTRFLGGTYRICVSKNKSKQTEIKPILEAVFLAKRGVFRMQKNAIFHSTTTSVSPLYLVHISTFRTYVHQCTPGRCHPSLIDAFVSHLTYCGIMRHGLTGDHHHKVLERPPVLRYMQAP